LKSIQQYQREERSMILNRLRNARYQVKDIVDEMCKDTISLPENVIQLRGELAKHYGNNDFLSCESMGKILRMSIKVMMNSILKKGDQL
jgi:predicted transcriptional regulator